MDDKTIHELFAKQGQVITTSALRISVLEKLLLDKGVLTKEELAEVTRSVSEELTSQIREALKQAAKDYKNK
jgi:TPP-dependent pyruvate/acetoin dehydrogenase alpha subunit